MMFSSVFTVVQSSENLTALNVLLGQLWRLLLCVTATSPIYVADFLFTYPCNPPVHPSTVVPCHSALLRAVHLTHLSLLDMNSRRL